MAASTEGLVPITRAFLAKFYDKYPFELSPSVPAFSAALKERYLQMNEKWAKETGDSLFIEKLKFDPPHKIDENLWKNREQIEECIAWLEKRNWPVTIIANKQVTGKLEHLMMEMINVLNNVKNFQSSSSEKVFNMILTYMPQDFRGSLIKQQRERSERKRQAEVETLVNNGGSIHAKYMLLWKQQVERRRQLALLGSASGVYKTLVKYLVGVPQVLLDFVQKINDHNGPMEEQRQRYGPPLYQLTELSLCIRIFLDLWWKTSNCLTSLTDNHLTLFEESVKAYVAEMSRYLTFLGEVFDNSPFLISADQAGLCEAKNDFKETIIATGKIHEVFLAVETEGSYVAWDFRLTSGKDVGFSVDFIDSKGMKLQMLPYQRYDAHQGNFVSPGVGSYRLVWDNTYSTFNKKTLRYKVDAIPPVPDSQRSEDLLEEA